MSIYPLAPNQLYTAVVGVYSNNAGPDGNEFQLWAMGGQYLGPAVSFPMAPVPVAPGAPGAPATPKAPGSSSASTLAMSSLLVIAALLALF